jgi:hypothetical protein
MRTPALHVHYAAMLVVVRRGHAHAGAVTCTTPRCSSWSCARRRCHVHDAAMLVVSLEERSGRSVRSLFVYLDLRDSQSTTDFDQ